MQPGSCITVTDRWSRNPPSLHPPGPESSFDPSARTFANRLLYLRNQNILPATILPANHGPEKLLFVRRFLLQQKLPLEVTEALGTS